MLANKARFKLFNSSKYLSFHFKIQKQTKIILSLLNEIDWIFFIRFANRLIGHLKKTLNSLLNVEAGKVGIHAPKKKKKFLIAYNLLRFIDYLHKFELNAADVGHP